jgi:hypothetical protein
VSFSVVLVTRAGKVPAITGRRRAQGESKIALSGIPKMNAKVFIAPGMAVHRRDDHAISKHLRHFVSAGDLQTCPGEGRAAGDARVCVWPFR